MPSDECTRDNNMLPLSLIPSILTDIRTMSTAGEAHRLKCIYIIIANALVLISCINNLISIQTLSRHRIRITPLGVYLILFTIFSAVEMFALEVSIVLAYTRELSVSKSYRYVYCNILSSFSVTPSFLALWLSAFIAIERVLIQCFKLSLYRTRKWPVVFVSLLCIVICGEQIYRVSNFVPIAVDNRLNLSHVSCRTYYNQTALPYIDILDSVHIITPVIINLLCSVFVLISIARHQAFIRLSDNYYSHFCGQISKHRDFFIAPLFILVTSLPHEVFAHYMNICIDSSQKSFLRLHITLIFFQYLPHTFTFLIYIYPSRVYLEEFRRTKIGQCLRRRKPNGSLASGFSIDVSKKKPNLSNNILRL
jgi:hypothetical protein